MKYTPYSNSKINRAIGDVSGCMLAFKYNYLIEKDTIINTQEQQVGKGVHAFMDEYVTHLETIKQPTDWAKADEIAKRISENYMRPEVRADILELCEKASRWYGHVFEARWTFSEVKMAVDANWKKVDFKDKNAYYRGIVDRFEFRHLSTDADGNPFEMVLVVADYKSGFKITDETNPEESYQIKTYALMLYEDIKANWPAWREKLGLPGAILSNTIQLEVWNLRFTKIAHFYTTIMDLQEVKAKIAEKIATIESRPFEGNIGDHCSNCEFRYGCEHLNRTEEGITATVHQWLKVKNENAAFEKTVKGHFRLHGNMKVDGKMFGFQEKIAHSFDGLEAVNAIIEKVKENAVGENADTAEKVARLLILEWWHLSKTDMAKLCKKLKIKYEDIQAIASVSKKNEFGFVDEVETTEEVESNG